MLHPLKDVRPTNATLEAAWEDAPDRLAMPQAQSATFWTAQLAAISGTNVSVTLKGRAAFGAIEQVRRGSLGVFRITLSPQVITSKLNPDTEGNLIAIVVLAGRLGYTGQGERRVVAPGEVLIAPCWDEFRLEAEDSVDILVFRAPIWWTMDKGVGPDRMRWLGAPDLVVEPEFTLHPVLLSAAAALVRCWQEVEYAAQAEHLFGTCLIQTLNAATPASRYSAMVRTRFVRVYNYVMVNVADEALSPREAANALRMSLRTLHQSCADNGTTFNSIVSDMRLRYAAYLLKGGEPRISEVAFATGYKSLPHFCRQFKEKYGISARLYRAARGGAGGSHETP